LKTLLILSCSWGAGEWGTDNAGKYGIRHPGMTQYLRDEIYDVWNLSQPASDLIRLVGLFKHAVQCNPHKQFIPLLIQTDIGRSFPFREFPMLPGETIQEFLNRFYLEIYKEFNDAAEELGVDLYVVGGLTDVTVDLSSFSRLKLVSPSWCGLADPSVPMVQTIDIDSINYLNWKYKDYKDQIIELFELAAQRWKFFDRNPELFYPDGQHPNRDMHRLLSNHLINYFKTQENVQS
jgi:hypothetical protein